MRTRRRLAASLLAASAASTAGCGLIEPKVTSPFSGQPVTEAGLAREIRLEEQKAKAAAADAARASAAELRDAQTQARLAALDIAKKQSVSAAELEAEAARVEAVTGQRVAAATAAAEAAAKTMTERLGLIADQGKQALSELDEQRERTAGILGAVTQAPGFNAANAAALGIPGLLLGWLGRSAGSRKRHDNSYEQGVADEKARQQEARDRENKAWDEAKAEAQSGQILHLVAGHAKGAA